MLVLFWYKLSVRILVWTLGKGFGRMLVRFCVWFWYVYCKALVCYRLGFGMILVWFRRELGTALVWPW